ncbi:hypothetical protein RRG08_018762 [Elysia crispata]|uniref:Transmembrane protein 245 n=1 Tax=Elysia crispata TaxID=231223 RepID=A0AAE1B1P3_9GAST|nr:hypothetical protein RRG08_018762 [Elysia crispata]
MASFDASTISPRSRPSIAYQLNSIMSMWQLVPQGHEKHLKQAFYNTLANVFIIFTAAAAVGVYYILAPFLQPLYWSLLCGTFLYPFKWRLTNALRSWLTGLQKSGTPFAVGLVVLPVQISNNIATAMTEIIWDYRKALIAFVIGLPVTYCLYYFAPPDTVLQMTISFLVSLNGFVDYFNSNWVIALFLGYMLCVAFMWTPETTWIAYLAAPVWVAMFLLIANVAGPFRVPLFLLLITVVFVGIIKEILPDSEESSSQTCLLGEEKECSSEREEALKGQEATATVEQGPTVSGPVSETAMGSAAEDPTKESTGFSSSASATVGGLHKQGQSKSLTESVGKGANSSQDPTASVQPGSSKSSPAVLDKPDSLPLTRTRLAGSKENSAELALSQLRNSEVNSYFNLLLLGHFIVRVWMHLWIVTLLFLLPLLHYCGRLLIRQFHEGGIFYEQAERTKASFSNWVDARRSALMPKCLQGVGSFLMKGDQQIISVIEKGLDEATSILFILMLLVGTLLFSIIGAVQIQRETVYMVSATQTMLNNTMSSEFSEWMPKADEIKTNMDRFLKNSHQQGRNVIASKVTDFMPQDSTKEERDNLVNQILEIWDKLYDTVLASLAEKPKNPSNHSSQKGEDSNKDAGPANLIDTVGSTVNHVSGMLHMSAAMEFVQQNLGMFMSVLESVFTVMKSNMTLILTVFTFIFSAILGGGTAILNFVLASIIFLTSLFYLLSSSGDVYKPVEIFKSIPGSTGSSFATAVEQAISGVFTASLKMAAFYGLYTWLVHLVFGMEIVFIPSALAAVFAAIPFLGPYWAAVPAVIELWLVQGRGLCALTLFLAHMLPSSVVDAKIYGEIEGGHPYVTGLAIAGGIMFMGLQGAIIGPIILCFFIVVFKMYGSLLDPDQVPPTPHQSWRFRSMSSEGFHTSNL